MRLVWLNRQMLNVERVKRLEETLAMHVNVGRPAGLSQSRAKKKEIINCSVPFSLINFLCLQVDRKLGTRLACLVRQFMSVPE
jgi:hypothetical protein